MLRAALPFLGSRLRPELVCAAPRGGPVPADDGCPGPTAGRAPAHLDGSEREAVLAEVLDGIRRLGERQDRVRVVRQLAEHLSGTERGAVMAGLLEVNRTRGWVDQNDRSLEPLELSALLAPGIDPASRRILLLEALARSGQMPIGSSPTFTMS